MNNKGSTSLLIIFLCALIFCLGWLMINNQHAKEVNLLNEEIKKLNQKIENIKKLKDEEIEELKESSPSSETTPSAKPSSSPASLDNRQSQDIEPQTDINSGCSVCGE